MGNKDALADKMKVKLDKSDFGEWYNQVVEVAGLCDKRYPIKGMNVWTPYGWKIMRSIDTEIRSEMDRTGHDEVCFPLLIPKTEFQKEADHIKGFDAEVYWVTHGGLNELDVPMLLRPTSETAMYPMFNLWIRSHADLPLKTFQIVNTFRYETKMTRAFIRVREIHFFEAHTCHATFEDAEAQIREDVEIMQRLSKALCIPVMYTKRPDWDKFAGADYTVGIDCLMPSGRTLQLGSAHQYRENFSKAYDIKYEAEDGEHRNVHQTTYGMSERLLGAIIGIHGDDRGVVLPPGLAPFQIVLIPILAGKDKQMILNEAEKVREELESFGLRVKMDDRDIRPGSKFYDWEIKGVPVRLELGPKDIEKESVMSVRRDNGEKMPIPREELLRGVRGLLDRISSDMISRAQKVLLDNIREGASPEDAAETFGITRLGWCGSEDCGHQVEDRGDVSILGTLYEVDGAVVREDGKNPACCVCGKPDGQWIYVSRTH